MQKPSDAIQFQPLLYYPDSVIGRVRFIADRVQVTHEFQTVVAIDVLDAFLFAGVPEAIQDVPIFFVSLEFPLRRLYILEVRLDCLGDRNLVPGRSGWTIRLRGSRSFFASILGRILLLN
jgi:hypothetical protein